MKHMKNFKLLRNGYSMRILDIELLPVYSFLFPWDYKIARFTVLSGRIKYG